MIYQLKPWRRCLSEMVSGGHRTPLTGWQDWLDWSHHNRQQQTELENKENVSKQQVGLRTNRTMWQCDTPPQPHHSFLENPGAVWLMQSDNYKRTAFYDDCESYLILPDKDRDLMAMTTCESIDQSHTYLPLSLRIKWWTLKKNLFI